MQNFDNIKDIWKKTPADLPSSKEILAEVERARKKMMWKNLLGIISLSATFLFITFIGFYYEFDLWTTKAGIILTLIAIALGVISMSGMMKRLMNKADGTQDNASYLEDLKNLQSKQRFLQNTGMGIYFVLLTTGLILYMYEFAKRDLSFGIIAYTITISWMAFNWFYVRKKTNKKQEKVIEEQIQRIERLVKEIRKEEN